VNVDEHHLVPKAFGGRAKAWMHRMCHQKIHATFSERDMHNYYHTFERMLDHEEIKKFVVWIRKKPLEFYDSNKDTKERKAKRRR
jgi:hypothetical protein